MCLREKSVIYLTFERETMTKKRIYNSPSISMRLNDADKKALRLVAAHMGTSQTEAVRRMTRERLESYSLATMPKTARTKQ